VTLLCGNVVSEEDEPSYNKAFYDACAHGKLEKVKNFIAEDPEWVNRPTPDGETCLHLTAGKFVFKKNFRILSFSIILWCKN